MWLPKGRLPARRDETIGRVGNGKLSPDALFKIVDFSGEITSEAPLPKGGASVPLARSACVPPLFQDARRTRPSKQGPPVNPAPLLKNHRLII